MEIELKIKVDDHGIVRRQLLARRGERLGACIESNTFFDTPDHSLLRADKGLRIRVTQDLESNLTRATLTWKGPSQSAQINARDELELSIDAAPTAAAMLRALGYVELLSFQKTRESWRLNNCRVELDDVPGLGLYVEIEGPAEPAIKETAIALGLSPSENERRSYPILLLGVSPLHEL